jgi:hypothetical protein
MCPAAVAGAAVFEIGEVPGGRACGGGRQPAVSRRTAGRPDKGHIAIRITITAMTTSAASPCFQ